MLPALASSSVLLCLAAVATASVPIVEVGPANFAKDVMESPKDVLVLVYVPWHPYSDRMFSALSELAQDIVSDDRLVLAINDGDAAPIAHPWRNTNLLWFSMYLFKQNAKESPVVYDVQNKGHALEDFKKFLGTELYYTNPQTILGAESGLPKLAPPFYKTA